MSRKTENLLAALQKAADRQDEKAVQNCLIKMVQIKTEEFWNEVRSTNKQERKH